MTALPAISISGLRKRFGDNEVLRGIDLTADDGDVISLIGASGSGKSTLLRCIPMLEIPMRARCPSGQTASPQSGKAVAQ